MFLNCSRNLGMRKLQPLSPRAGSLSNTVPFRKLRVRPRREKAGTALLQASCRIRIMNRSKPNATGPGSDRALSALLAGLGVPVEPIKQPGPVPAELRPNFDPAERQHRQVKELEEYTQKLFRSSESARADAFWSKVKAASPQEWE